MVYISVGRNNRCFVRDLIRLLMNIGGLPRERIGDIRLFDTYSFVQLYVEDALRVIKALDGYVYQGRSLVANIAHQREDAETRSSGAPEPAHNRPADLSIEAEQTNAGASDASVQVAADAEIAAADCNAETAAESGASADSEA
ncbi:DbpA RNA binding domain-containing protein, partial [Treponema endosymbiont of Eucomonympha sp.]|uniref:DbpA RNA binding domain-containing protein n=1 Tax=Treponema endosymbiont of Eucomonympha sp. TaxID=1580831 RepID=UPI00164FF98B